MIRKIHWIVIAWLTALPAAQAMQTASYVAYYKGMFSLFRQMEIADVQLTRNMEIGEDTERPVRKMSLAVSSANFPTVERLYPFRYLFDSYIDVESGATFAFEHLKKAGKQKHYVGFMGIEPNKARVFSAKGLKPLLQPEAYRSLLAGSDTGQWVKENGLTVKSRPVTMPGRAYDRLTLLDSIPQQLKAGTSQQEYLVTDAKKLMSYRVSILSHEALKVGGKTQKAVKVKIEGFDFTEPKVITVSQENPFPGQPVTGQKPNYLHAPVYAWFSDDGHYWPLKFLNKHSVGEFVIEWKSNNNNKLQNIFND